MTVTEMRQLLNLSRPAFGRIYHIPVRTLENWEAGVRKAPEYVLYLLERAVKEDAEHPENLLFQSVDAQIEEAHRDDLTEQQIIDNRFL